MKKVLLVVLAVVAIVAPQAVFASEAPQLVATAVMPDIALKTSSNLAIESSVANDEGILLGGMGSDLFHVPGDAENIFYVVTRFSRINLQELAL